MKFTQKTSRMKHHFLSGRDSRVKPGNDRLRLGNSKFLIVLLVPLLFTSCLADILNDKLDFKVPVTIQYVTDQGEQPSSIKFPSKTKLTTQELPVLSEAGWTFSGWYLDKNYINPASENTELEKDTTLYAKWTAHTNTPFTIYNYFLDISTGSHEFIMRTDKTQYLTGTTGEMIDQNNYNLRYSSPNDSEMNNYELVCFYDDSFNKSSIKGDGSTHISNYYYKNHIHDYELEELLSVLPDNKQTYSFVFIQDSSSDEFNFETIKTAIFQDFKTDHSYYDTVLGKTVYIYNKYLSLNFTSTNITQIPSYAFLNIKNLRNVVLPGTCTNIGHGAFLNCEELNYVQTNNWDGSKAWYYYDNDSGDPISLGISPDANYFAGILKTTYSQVSYY